MTGNPSALDLDPLLADEGFLRGIARGLLFDEHAVDDIVQQAWLRALEHPPRDPAAARGFLASVVRNLSRNELRGARRRRQRETASARVEDAPSPAAILEREAARTRILDAVLGLAEPYRGTILLRYYEGLAPTQIARRAGLPAATVRTRLKRALEQLRARLDAAHGGDRRAWCLTLIPLARPERVAAGLVGSLTSVAVLVLTMKKVWLVLAALILLATGAALWWPEGATGTLDEAAGVECLGDGLVTSDRIPAPRSEGAPARVAARPPGESLADLYPGALAGFRGRLVDPGGAPVGQCAVRMLSADSLSLFSGTDAAMSGEPSVTPRIDRHETRSDDAGQFLLEGIWPRGRHVLFAGAEEERAGFSIVQRSPGPGEIVDLGDVVVEASGVVTGTVVGDDGAPVVGANVWAADVPGAMFAAVPLDRFRVDGPLLVRAPEVTATPTGGFAVEDLSLHWLIQRSVEDAPGPAALGPGYLVLEAPGWLREMYRALPLARTRTDAAGRFHLRGLVPGGNALVVQADGWRDGGNARVLVRAGKPRDVGQIVLQRGDAVQGRVVDATGAPIAGAQVLVAAAAGLVQTGLLCAQPIVRSDASGAFVVPGVRAGRVMLGARVDAGRAWRLFGPFDSSESHELQLAAGVTCTFVLHSDSAMVGDARLTLVPGPAAGELFRFGLQAPLDLTDRLAVAPGRLRVADLEPGLYTVQVAAAGHTLFTETMRIVDNGERQIRLAPRARCSVAVVDAGGRPVRDALVHASPQPVPDWLQSRLPSGSSLDHWRTLPAFVVRTGPDGLADISGCAPGDVELTAQHPAFGWTAERVSLPRAPVRLQLPACGAIDGQLFERGTPASGGEWRIVAYRQNGDGDAAIPAAARMAVPESEGRFRLAGLTPGEYLLATEGSLASVRSFGAILEHVRKVDYDWGSDRGATLRVTVRAGETAVARFDVDATRAAPGAVGASARGTITLDGQPAVGLQLVYGPGDTIVATVDAAGRVEARGLQADGSASLSLVDPRTGSTFWRDRTRLQAGDERSVDLHLHTGALAGIVLLADGSAAPDCDVTAIGVGAADGLRIAGKTDSSGRFSLRVPAGVYAVRADWQNLQRGEVASVAVRGAEVTDAGSLQLAVLPRFEGRVAFADPPPPRVGLVLQSETIVKWLLLGEGGSFDVRDLQPGVYTVTLAGPGIENATVPATIEIGAAPLLDQVLRVGPGKRP